MLANKLTLHKINEHYPFFSNMCFVLFNSNKQRSLTRLTFLPANTLRLICDQTPEKTMARDGAIGRREHHNQNLYQTDDLWIQMDFLLCLSFFFLSFFFLMNNLFTFFLNIRFEITHHIKDSLVRQSSNPALSENGT